jgi:hypothetical protein
MNLMFFDPVPNSVQKQLSIAEVHDLRGGSTVDFWMTFLSDCRDVAERVDDLIA